jgi:hypothetical protein
VEARSGSARSEIEVEVIRKIQTDTLVIPDSGGVVFTLNAGNYAIEVEAKAGDNGVTLSWVGGVCPDQPEKQHHRVRCKVDNTATLKINNPSVFGLGASASGYINIYEVP